MRKFLTLAILSIFSLPLAHADFFDSNVINTDSETNAIERIILPYHIFSDARENTRYQNAKKFIEWVKQEAINRYQAGSISYYRMNDVVRDLDSLVYAIDQHFSYFSRYEQTRKSAYREASDGYYEEARTDYQRLRATLGRSGQGDYTGTSTSDISHPGYYYMPIIYDNNSF